MDKYADGLLLEVDKIIKKKAENGEQDFYKLLKKLIQLKIKNVNISKFVDDFEELAFSMSRFDFGKRLEVFDNTDRDFLSQLAVSMNGINEELEYGVVKKQHFQDLMDTFPFSLAVTDVGGIISSVNELFIELMEYDEHELLNQPILSFLSDDFAVAKDMEMGSNVRDLGVNLLPKKIAFIPTLLSIHTQHGASGEPDGYIYVFKETEPLRKISDN